MKRAFDSSSISDICERLKSALNNNKSQIEAMRSIASQAESAAGSVPGYVTKANISGAAQSLRSQLQSAESEIEDFLTRLDQYKTRATTLIPAADQQYGAETKELVNVINQVREVLSQLEGFLVNTPLTVDYKSFQAALDVKKAKYEKVLNDANQAIDTLLRNVKGAEDISQVFSKDPVNLSTGNFIFDKTDLEIGGATPFIFRRFYNAINERSGVLGRDWNHNYEVHLEVGTKETTLILEEGKEEVFLKTSTGIYASLYQSNGMLEETEEGYCYQTRDQREYLFDREGYYLQQRGMSGANISLHYEETGNKKQLIKVEQETGESFSLTYDEEGYLTAVTDHTGRQISYERNGNLLTGASTPEGGWYRYGYTAQGKLECVQNPRDIVTVENQYDGQQRITHQTFPDGSSMSYAYDDEARTVELTERNGSKVTYVHDEKYRDIKHIHRDGEERFEYNQNNQKTLVVDKLGNKTQITYDNSGNLTGIINPLGTKTSITYETHNKPTVVSVNGKRKLKNLFDNSGNLLETLDGLGRKTTFTYNSKNLPECVIQADGSRILLSYDERGNIKKLTDSRGGITRYTYDQLNRIIETVDPNENRTRYTYDKAGNLHTVIIADGCERTYKYNESNKVTEIIDFNGSTIQRVYNSLNKPEKLIDQLGRETKLKYDAMWNLARVTEPNGAVTMYIYNENNRLGRVKDAKGNVKRYTYDSNGNCLSETDENGVSTHFMYDALGQLIQVEGSEGLKYTYAYDAEGRITEVTDALGGKVIHIYDEAGQLTQEINQQGSSRSYTYTCLGDVESVTDEAGRTTRYEYLPGGKIVKVIHSDGTIESYTYDGNRNVKTYTNPSGFIRSYFYDRLDRITQITGSEGEKKEYTYDAVGNVMSVTDGLGNCTCYEYTLTGQLKKVIDPLGNETEYYYDVCDRLIEIRQFGENEGLIEGTDTLGMDAELLAVEQRNQKNQVCHVTKYQRNLLGQVETITDALGLQEHYGYNPKGQLIEKLDKEGYLTKYGYTGLGDVKNIQYADGREVKYSYNPLRHLQEVEDWLGLTKIDTDSIGRAKKVKYPDGTDVSYTYGKAGERTSLTYPDGRTVYYGFDEQLRLSELKDGDQVITYAYDEAGRLAEKQFPNGLHTAYSYDSKGQIQELIHMDEEGILDQYQYQYDVIGNKTGIVKQRRGLENESGNYQYGHDPLGRLNEVVKNGQTLRYYQYDAFGNRTYKREGENITSYRHNSLNQLIIEVTVGGDSTEKTYEYDRRGNLSQVIENGTIRNQYLYGALNRLEQAANNKGEMAKYQYNGLGHRVGKEEGRTKIQNIAAVLDPVILLKEQTLSPDKKIQYTIDLTREYHNLLQKEENKQRQTYLWDGNVAGLSEEGRNNICYYLQDELGSPIRLLNNEGNLSESYGYDEFGKLYQNNRTQQPFGYTGYQEDIISETYFAQAREYSPHQGQFLERDRITGFIELPFTLNQYSYCFNNPINLVDLNGKWPKQIENIGDKLGSAADWIGDKVSDAGHFLYDNTIGKIVGTEQVLYETEYGGGSYEVTSHTGGDIIVIKKDQEGRFDGWSLNADFSFGGIISNKQSISGKGWNPESWKYTNDLEISGPGGISFAGGLHIDKDGVGVQGVSSGTTGNMPLKLPDGTQIDEFGSVSWSLTVENDIANWKQVLETVGVTAAIVGLIWVVANDATIIGIVDDVLVAPLVTYLATKAPTIYQWFSQLSPEIIKAVNSWNTCKEVV